MRLAERACVVPSQGEQLVEAGVWPAAAEALQDVADVLPGVADSGQLAAADHGVQNGEAASTVVAAGKQPVLSSDGNGPQRALCVVVIDALRAIAQEQGERIPLPQRAYVIATPKGVFGGA